MDPRLGRALAPIYDFIDLQHTAEVRTLKDTMYVVFNRLREKFVVMDRDNDATPYIIMVVQEPDGSFRQFDERTMESLRRAVFRGPSVRAMMQEMDQNDRAREQRIEKDADELAYGFVDTIKWAGTDVVASTLWRDRTSHHLRERIREEARASTG